MPTKKVISAKSCFKIYLPLYLHFDPQNKYDCIKYRFAIKGNREKSFERAKGVYNYIGSKFENPVDLIQFFVSCFADSSTKLPTIFDIREYFDYYLDVNTKKQNLYKKLLTNEIDLCIIQISDWMLINRKPFHNIFCRSDQVNETQIVRMVMMDEICDECVILVDERRPFLQGLYETESNPLVKKTYLSRMIAYSRILLHSGLYPFTVNGTLEKMEIKLRELEVKNLS